MTVPRPMPLLRGPVLHGLVASHRLAQCLGHGRFGAEAATQVDYRQFSCVGFPQNPHSRLSTPDQLHVSVMPLSIGIHHRFNRLQFRQIVGW